MASKKRKAIGITCGIGSMLIGARQAGFAVEGNVEWRKYYGKNDANGQNTFRVNFPGALFKEVIDDLDPAEIERMMNADIALGHPECGNFSQLGGVNKGHKDKLLDPTDIPLFIDLVARLRPRFFVMDDLPKSFGAFPMSEYAKRLPDYDLFPEWVSNWGYGNVQTYRNRMFMLGSLREEKWAFTPGEAENKHTLADVIGDLPEPRVGSNFPNHDPWAPEEKAQKSLSLRKIGDRPTWRELAEYAEKNWRPGQSMTYFANDGTIKLKPGCKIEHWDRGASVQDGGSYKLHPLRFSPLTLRERARIQGFPDDFVFYGANLNEVGEYNNDRNTHMAKQTGKAMPVQFCHYVSSQVHHHLEGKNFRASNQRVLRPNEFVDDAKRWYCSNVGYSDQKRACSNCWLYSTCSIRSQQYSIGDSVPSHSASPIATGEPSRKKEGRPLSKRAAAEKKQPAVMKFPRSSRFADLATSHDLDFGGKKK